VARLFMDIKGDVETGTALSQAFRKYPLYFDSLFCNLVGAGEQAGILDDLLDRLATYKEKMQAIKGKIKSALFYPMSVIIVAAWSSGDHAVRDPGIQAGVRELRCEPAGAHDDGHRDVGLLRRLLVPDVRGAIGGGYFFMQAWRRSPQMAMDRLMLQACRSSVR
jgi:type IV pilus assembly protein PilC